MAKIINYENARKIRQLYNQHSQTVLAKIFHVSQATISKILHNKIYFDPTYSSIPDNIFFSKETLIHLLNTKSVYEIAKIMGVTPPIIYKWLYFYHIKTKKPSKRLTLHDARQIRYLYFTSQYNKKELAKQYQVGELSISRIINNITHKEKEYNLGLCGESDFVIQYNY